MALSWQDTASRERWGTQKDAMEEKRQCRVCVCVCVCVCVIVRGRFWIDFQNLFTPPNLLVLCLESPLQPRTLQIFLFLSSGIASLISIVDPMWNLF